MITGHKKRILICPLDWGLGHATRCIPIIKEFIGQNAEVFIGADGRPFELLKQAFPNLQFIRFPGYDITYPKGSNMVIKMGMLAPKILKRIKAEHEELTRIVKEYLIDAVISDNRYGLWNKDVYTVFLTHQLMIKAPVGERTIHAIVKNYVKKYNECWVPDYKGTSNLSGDLSHKFPVPDNTSYIGPLSRFSATMAPAEHFSYDIAAIVSGPEPQRTLFEEKLIDQLKEYPEYNAVIIRGITERNGDRQLTKNIRLVDHANTDEFLNIINDSEIIISRPGYSTLMDLHVLQKKAILIPTPGQTEQEYLADYISVNGIITGKQHDFNLKELIEKLKGSKHLPGFIKADAVNHLKQRVSNLLSSIN